LSCRTVAIDCLTEDIPEYVKDHCIVVVDVMRSTTVQITAVASGRRCFFASSVDSALLLAKQLNNPLLVGEVGGNMPYGFDINNSPVEIERHNDIDRPAIVLSSSGTQLLHALNSRDSVYIACLRNCQATVRYLIGRYDRIAVVGAPTRGEFREEDQLCCAWIADGLMKAGYNELNEKTIEIVKQWRRKGVEECAKGKSAEYLRKSGQERDLFFILNHVNDLNAVFRVKQGEIVRL
jgi:2-phosphosulfolactate phosphatase